MLTQDQKTQIEKLSGSISDHKIAKQLRLDFAMVKSHLTDYRARHKRKRERVFRLIMIMLPVLFISASEGILRVANYGGDLSLFVPVEGYPDLLKVNKNVGRRYFTSVGIVPETTNDVIARKKPDSGYRIFVMGGSSAIGYPYMHNGSMSKMLGQRLRDYFPQKEIEIANLAMPAINSFSLLDLADEALAHDPDAIVIYSGHNEFYGALGVGSTESLGSSRTMVNLYLRLQKLKLMLFLRDQIAGLKKWMSGGKAGNGADQATLMGQMVGDPEISYDSEKFNRAGSFYDANISAIVERAKEKGIRVILCGLVSNIRDQKPFISLFSKGIDQDSFDIRFREAKNLEESGQYEKALDSYQSLLLVDNSPAELHFRIGRCYEALNRYDEARNAYIKARDLDGLRFRAPSEFNHVLRRIARDHQIPFADFESAFVSESPNGLIGNELILEHLHPNLRGYFLMGRSLCLAMKKTGLIDADWNEQLHRPDSAYWAERGVTELDETLAKLRIELLTQNWPFVKAQSYNPLNFKPGTELERLALKAWEKEITWEKAHVDLAEHYTQKRDFVRAIGEYEALIMETPYNSSPYLRAGLLYIALKEYDLAVSRLSKSLALEETALANKMLGSVYVETSQPEQGIPYLKRSVAINPRDSQALYNLTGALLLTNDRSGAEKSLARLEKLAPGSKEVKLLKLEFAKLESAREAGN